MFAIFSVPVFGLRMRFRPSKVRRLLEIEAWIELPFFLVGVCFFLLFLGVDIPAFYIQLYGLREAIVPEKGSLYLLPVLNTVSLVGRIVSL
jgi:hypothetical protein